jgi:thiol-disulfide isomerase/thioredoxin
MKKISSLITSILILVVMFVLPNGCKVDNNKKDYLRKVLISLDKIKSATYYTTSESWAPGDTSASGIYCHYVKEYNNPTDSTIGSSVVWLLQEDTTQMDFCYDGNMRANVYRDHKTIVIDSFKIKVLPFRPSTPPFFNHTRSIIKYALETKDSILMETKDYRDSVYYKFVIFKDRQVEFFGKAYYMEKSPYDYGETTSRYELWINKKTDLPYRFRREMSHNISVASCRNVELNKINIEDFRASNYFQPDFTIVAYGRGRDTTKKIVLEGKVAPDWVLKDANNNTIALKDLKSKVLLVQFTSVNCGPCRASIPFLKQIVKEHNMKDFDFVSIESWTKNSNVLKVYQDRNECNYKFLMSTKEVTKSYNIQAVPVFFILDENRVIRKVIGGYGKGSTDKEIRDAINKLI